MNAAPRSNPKKTPQEAVEVDGEHLGRLQVLTYTAIHKAGLRGRTAHEAARTVAKGKVSIQPRISELRRKGLVVDSGDRRRNASGRRAIVWVVKAAVIDG